MDRSTDSGRARMKAEAPSKIITQSAGNQLLVAAAGRALKIREAYPSRFGIRSSGRISSLSEPFRVCSPERSAKKSSLSSRRTRALAPKTTTSTRLRSMWVLALSFPYHSEMKREKFFRLACPFVS